MKKIVLITNLVSITFTFANSTKELFESKCEVCHKIQVEDKSSLIAPPINKVIMHVKRSFKDKNQSIAFMKDYVINPNPKKTICPSIDIFGVMPSQKGLVTDSELDKIVNYIYDNFAQNNNGIKNKFRLKMAFMRIDSNNDGFISKEEFKTFRAKKEDIDIKKIKYNYFFDKLDTNKDGKLSKEEFKI
jgi:hypothetical protein